jgi:hypothetical protein
MKSLTDQRNTENLLLSSLLASYKIFFTSDNFSEPEKTSNSTFISVCIYKKNALFSQETAAVKKWTSES